MTGHDGVRPLKKRKLIHQLVLDGPFVFTHECQAGASASTATGVIVEAHLRTECEVLKLIRPPKTTSET